MNKLVRLVLTGAVCLAAACGDDSPAPPDTVSIILFQAAPDAIETGQSTKLVFAVNPPTASVTISDVGDETGKSDVMVSPTATTTYQLTAKNGTATTMSSVTVTVGPQTASAFKVQPATATPTAGDQVAVTVTAISSTGETAPGYRGTVHLTSSDPAAVLPADFELAAADAGVKQVMVTLKTAGAATLTANDVAKVGAQGAATVTVQPGAASSYALTTLPATANAGQSLVLTITAHDAFGNVATAYAGAAQLTSTDATDVLPASGGFTAGVRTVSLAFLKAGSHIATVSDPASVLAAVDTSSVVVTSGAPFRIATTTANPSTTAGTPEGFTATLVDLYGNVCSGYVGTLHFVSSDPNATVPADYTFLAGDAGTHAFSVTLETAGTDTVFLSDTASAAFSGSASWTVGAAAASTCTATQTSASVVAGMATGVTVAVRDSFGNLASNYAGTMHLTTTDARATFPSDVTYVPAVDAGSHAFAVWLITTGGQSVTATDTANAALTCTASLTITPAAPKIVLAVAADANAGYPSAVNVTMKDVFDNAITSYAGTVTFTSSDSGTGAAAPAPITFNGSEGGVASTSATYVTMGTQTLSATDASSPVATGSASTAVHGLAYSAPSTGRVRLVVNAAASNAQVVQLDLVANERLEISPLFSSGPPIFAIGSFAAGMNLPLDTTRVGADATLFTAGPALPAGAGTRAAAGALGTDHVLYAAVSAKRDPASDIMTQATEVQAGQVFFSVRLKLAATGTPGAVFDGAQPSPLLRAAVRDQYGDDFVSLSDIGVGKLEIK